MLNGYRRRTRNADMLSVLSVRSKFKVEGECRERKPNDDQVFKGGQVLCKRMSIVYGSRRIVVWLSSVGYCRRIVVGRLFLKSYC